MANKLYEETYIQAIADSIRGKTGKTDTMTVSQMASEIDGIAVLKKSMILTQVNSDEFIVESSVSALKEG